MSGELVLLIHCDRCDEQTRVPHDARWTHEGGVDRCPDCTDRLTASRKAAQAWREVYWALNARWWVYRVVGKWFTWSPTVGGVREHATHADAIAHADRMAREGRR